MSSIARPGRPVRSKPKILVARPLTREDLVHLAPERPRAQQGAVKRFRETHHRLARLVAFGYRYEQIADMTGYSVTRLYNLGPTPAFQELVAQYRGRVDRRFDEEYDDFKQTSETNLRRMEHQVAQHLDEAEANEELIPLKTLAALISDRADRFGYGKHSTQTNVNVNLASRLEQMYARSARAKPIEGTSNSPLSMSPRSPPVVNSNPQLPGPPEASLDLSPAGLREPSAEPSAEQLTVADRSCRAEPIADRSCPADAGAAAPLAPSGGEDRVGFAERLRSLVTGAAAHAPGRRTEGEGP